MTTRPALILVAVLLVAVGPAVSAPGETDLSRLAALAGEWTVLDATGEPSPLRARYEVAAGGAAVLEKLFLDTPEETVTLYHVAEGGLAATVVSARGGPDRLVPSRVAEAGTVGLASPEETPAPGRVVSVRLTPLAADRLRIEWVHAGEGNRRETRTLELRRELAVAGLAAEVSRLRVSLETLQRELDRRLKTEVEEERRGKPGRRLLETVTRPPGPGWSVSGVPFRQYVHEQATAFATTYSLEGDRGMTVGHYGFRAGKGCRVTFSVLGGNAFIAVVEESRPPPRRIESIPDFAAALETGEFGRIVERISGEQWAKHPVAVDWDLERFAGRDMRLYVVDAVTNHYGQIAVSDIRIREEAD